MERCVDSHGLIVIARPCSSNADEDLPSVVPAQVGSDAPGSSCFAGCCWWYVPLCTAVLRICALPTVRPPRSAAKAESRLTFGVVPQVLRDISISDPCARRQEVGLYNGAHKQTNPSLERKQAVPRRALICQRNVASFKDHRFLTSF